LEQRSQIASFARQKVDDHFSESCSLFCVDLKKTAEVRVSLIDFFQELRSFFFFESLQAVD
jgi:hypothetical protein